jgi:hypothetical protein
MVLRIFTILAGMIDHVSYEYVSIVHKYIRPGGPPMPPPPFGDGERPPFPPPGSGRGHGPRGGGMSLEHMLVIISEYPDAYFISYGGISDSARIQR